MTKYCYFLCIFFQLIIKADVFSHPVDISFLVADVKYSRERGVQICEIQHGVDSAFKGEVFSNGGFSLIAENFVDFFAFHNKSSWVFSSGINDQYLKDSLEKNLWKKMIHSKELGRDNEFKLKSVQPVFDTNSIASYHGFVFAKSGTIEKLSQLHYDKSLILIDSAMLPIRRDKYKVSLCLRGDPLLESCKPKWNLYKRKYQKNLAEQIIKDLGSTHFVIKPRDKFRGNGVIIVDKENLDQTLKYIFSKSGKLKKDPDRAYKAWYNEKADTFLVEEFVPSDPVIVPHLGMKPYCPTLRIAFLLIHEQGDTDICFLGGYYCLPKKPLSEKGSLHQKYKACLEIIHSSQVDPDTYSTVIKQLSEPLRLFYKKVLEFEE